MNQESRYSDVLSDTQAARMDGIIIGARKGRAEGLRMAAEIVGEYPLCNGIVEKIIAKAKEVEEAKNG